LADFSFEIKINIRF
jgi:hypothetical protein